MLKIKDLSKLKITKVKPWAMYFDYDGEKYLLHEHEEEYEHYTTLYKRIPINNGKYELEIVCGKFGFIPNCISPTRYGCYKHIDKEYMIKKLTYYGFCCGLYDEYVEGVKYRVNGINDKIRELETKKRELETKKRELLEMRD